MRASYTIQTGSQIKCPDLFLEFQLLTVRSNLMCHSEIICNKLKSILFPYFHIRSFPTSYFLNVTVVHPVTEAENLGVIFDYPLISFNTTLKTSVWILGTVNFVFRFYCVLTISTAIILDLGLSLS